MPYGDGFQWWAYEVDPLRRRCFATKQNGERCTVTAKPGDLLCPVHAKTHDVYVSVVPKPDG